MTAQAPERPTNRALRRSYFTIPPTRMSPQPSKRKHACKMKAARYASHAAAERDARAASVRYSEYVHAFQCTWDDSHWHIGRPKRFLKWLYEQRRHGPIDVTLLDAIGDRAYHCGKVESFGPARNRRRHINKRVFAAQKWAERKEPS